MLGINFCSTYYALKMPKIRFPQEQQNPWQSWQSDWNMCKNVMKLPKLHVGSLSSFFVPWFVCFFSDHSKTTMAMFSMKKNMASQRVCLNWCKKKQVLTVAKRCCEKRSTNLWFQKCIKQTFQVENSCKPNILDNVLPRKIGINIASYVRFPGRVTYAVFLPEGRNSSKRDAQEESRGTPSRYSRSHHSQDTWGAGGRIFQVPTSHFVFGKK